MGMAATELSYVKEEEALKAWMIVCRTNFRKTAGSQTEISEDKLDFDYISMEELEEKNGRKTQQDYRLFRFRDGKVRLLDMVIDGGNGWAVDLWDAVEDEL